MGRFVQRDPAGFGGGLNVYLYAGANPVTGVDPSGLWLPGSDDTGIITNGIAQVGCVSRIDAPFSRPQLTRPMRREEGSAEGG
ncbi:MAG: RHS repeat-associated core domain-containing protein [Phycisphaerae bacterium]